MRNLALAALVGLALGGAGCGSVCTRIGAANEGLNRKAGDCSVSKVDPYDVAACERGLSKCSADDVKELNNYAQCLENVSNCIKGQEASFTLSQVGCLSPASKVSLTCLNAIH